MVRNISIGVLIVLFVGCIWWFNERDSNVYEAKSNLVTDIKRKSEVTEPWNLQPRWYDTTNDALSDNGGQADTLPIMRGTIKSTENIFTCDFSMSYDPLKRPLTFVWYVDGIEQETAGSIFITTLSKDASHSIMLSLYVMSDNDEAEYAVGTGFYEEFDLETAFSETSPLDRFAK